MTRVLTGRRRRRARPRRSARRGPATAADRLRRPHRLRRRRHDRRDLAGDGDAGTTADRLVDLALEAGAPDNVTVVVADVVDDEASRRRPQPQIVGLGSAAARGSRRTRADPGHARREGCRTAARGNRRRATREPTTRSLSPRRARRSLARRWLRRAGHPPRRPRASSRRQYAGYNWTQRQYFIADHGGKVDHLPGHSHDLGGRCTTVARSATATDVRGQRPAQLRPRQGRPTRSRQPIRRRRQSVEPARRRRRRARSAKATGPTCAVASADATETTPDLADQPRPSSTQHQSLGDHRSPDARHHEPRSPSASRPAAAATSSCSLLLMRRRPSSRSPTRRRPRRQRLAPAGPAPTAAGLLGGRLRLPLRAAVAGRVRRPDPAAHRHPAQRPRPGR